jgi:hypothetical protein
VSVGVVAAVSLVTRAPLVLMNSYQGVMVARWSVMDSDPLHALKLVLRRGTLLAVPAILLGYVVGPSAMSFVFGANYRCPGWFAASAVTATAGLAALMTTGWMTVAARQHVAFLIGWGAAAAVMFGLLWLPFDVYARSALSIATAPVVGVAIHLLWLATLRREPAGSR